MEIDAVGRGLFSVALLLALSALTLYLFCWIYILLKRPRI